MSECPPRIGAKMLKDLGPDKIRWVRRDQSLVLQQAWRFVDMQTGEITIEWHDVPEETEKAGEKNQGDP